MDVDLYEKGQLLRLVAIVLKLYNIRQLLLEISHINCEKGVARVFIYF